MKQVQDHYFKKAKKEGYVARSAFKLEEIDVKHKLIKQGDKIIDLGCYPGSWMQYISKKIGANGIVLGVDRTPLKIQLADNMRFVHGDINELDLSITASFAPSFDLVCSDMAPNTTGNKSVDAARSFQLCQMALLVAQDNLKKKGATLVKIFQGETFDQLLKQMRDEYDKVKIIKPKSSRNESREIFLLGLNLKNK
ncbi:RlmE family RNA methyltransferase [bacterium]|nr:RlmE family RNA methyltransferase [bacterium]